MTTREALHRLVDSVPDENLDDARRAVEPFSDPVKLALANAPIDDEPTTPEEEREVQEAWEAYRRGEWVSAEEVRRELGL